MMFKSFEGCRKRKKRKIFQEVPVRFRFGLIPAVMGTKAAGAGSAPATGKLGRAASRFEP